MNRVILLADAGNESPVFLSSTITYRSGSNIPVQLPVTEEMGSLSTCAAPLPAGLAAGLSLQAAKLPTTVSVAKIRFLGVIACYLKKQNKHFPGLMKMGCLTNSYLLFLLPCVHTVITCYYYYWLFFRP